MTASASRAPVRRASPPGCRPTGLVFCCFNQSYKINPAIFDLWCRLLVEVPGSVLWLLGETQVVQHNLRQEAHQRGVAPERLIFATRTGYAEHLARFQLADVFLDTLPFNAGATASDALWAGVPIVTCLGDTFAGRMAASLLTAAGLPELVTRTPEDYHRLALELATQPDRLAEMKSRLAANRMSCPLFDSARFTHDLERLYQRMWTDYRAGTRQPIVSEAGDGGDSDSAEAHFNRANQLDDLKRHEEAINSYRRAIALKPDYAEAHNNLGNALINLNRPQEAVASYQKALAIKPGFADFHFNLGHALNKLGRHEEAVASFQKTLALKPDFPEAQYSLGNALGNLRRPEEAIASYRRAISLRPELAEAHNSLGSVLIELDRYQEAIESCEKALALKPDFAKAYCNLGLALYKLHRYEKAIVCYRRALALKPDFFEAHNNLGIVLGTLTRYDEAIACHQQALSLRPDSFETHSSLANALLESTRYTEAIASYQRALALNIDLAGARGSLIQARQQLCEWRTLPTDIAALRERDAQDASGNISPFGFLMIPGTHLHEQYRSAQRFAQTQYRAFLSRPPLCGTELRADPPRLRIGYLSGDFHDHPVMHLLAEVIERHDRGHFELFGYSCGPEADHPMRQRLRAAFGIFRDVAPLSHEDVARRILDDRIDILVDLSGYTANNRLPVLALRPAPVQVSWLGYPGTLGHPRLADYLIGDAIVTPLTHAAHYSETLALMPNCYQPNDRQRAIGDRPTRIAAGLPATGLVFCCFNQSNRINPAVFDLWCRLLVEVPGSVLWLLQPTTDTEHNLRREAQDRGVAPARLVFAPMLPLAKHLGRLQLADLALDTYPYTSHTTASDALWVGVPLVTRVGKTFAGRVAASIVHAAGLPELVTRTPEDYHRLALELATQPDRLAETKSRLAANRMSCPLFDSERFVRDLERIFLRMWTDYRAGTRRQIVIEADEKSRPGEIGLPAYTPAAVPTQGLQGAQTPTLAQALKEAFNVSQMGKPGVAEQTGRLLVQTGGDNFDALHLLDVLGARQGRVDEAIEVVIDALRRNPGSAEAHILLTACAWTQLTPVIATLHERVTTGKSGEISPLGLLPLSETNAGEHYLCARQYAEQQYGGLLSRAPLCGTALRADPPRLRIGYLSADFREHPVSYLVAEVIERHDRSRFEVFGYSYGPDSESPVRKRMQAAFDTFRAIRPLSHEVAAQQILDDRIDVLVDLTGYTTDTRLEILALRPAPVQVSWLGYPGTLGHPRLADYLIGDAIVTPLEHAARFSEMLALMPRCFQPNDRQRITGARPTRVAAGLPADGFVFCCFNQSYKINPAMFDLWCRLLLEVPGSVLWLLGETQVVQHNLRQEAHQRGVAPERLIFAMRTGYAGHLARFQLADVFLDTLPFNAGATASDALWAGVPVVTCLGDTFAGRMAASLLTAAGLPELVTRTPEDYHRLALELATQPDRLAEMKSRLAANRMSCPLFDSARFTHDLERLYQRMWTDYRAGTRQPIVSEAGDGGDSDSAEAHFNRANQLDDLKRHEEAVACYRKALAIDPGFAEALCNLAGTLNELRRHEEAVASCERAIALRPDIAEAHNNLGSALNALTRHAQALASCEKALALRPDFAEAHFNRGVALAGMQRHEEALASFRRAIALRPDFAEAHNSLGGALNDLGRHREAIESCEQALALRPHFAEAYGNLGLILTALNRHDEAIASCRKALSINPALAEAHCNLGLVLYALNRHEEAVACHRRALALRPDFAEAYNNLASTLGTLKRYAEASANYQQALALNPGLAGARGSLIHARQHLCEWQPLSTDIATLHEHEAKGKSGKIPPFIYLALPGTHLQDEYQSARQFAETQYRVFLARPPLYGTALRADPPRLRIGYLSADFHEHATSHLLAEILERHDRNRFEVFSYSYGPDDASPMRKRVRVAFDTFREIGRLSDEETAQQILDDRIDVLIDLKGYTEFNRLPILALRPAPVQVSWLGYPGTLGHPRLADYLIGDAIVTPLAHAAHYSETLALMPHCYQPNDRQRVIGDRPTRMAAGLPAAGFVFCCFNQSYKITPETFDLWCRLLVEVPGSVLWLLQPTTDTAHNLRREAQERGVSPERLVFAPRQSLSGHLGRLQLADLALDTFPYTSHTTASDALWAGVPLITRLGDTFASRVAASVVHAAGLPELVTRTPEDYHRLALELATQPDRLAEMKSRLAANRMSCPLFDSARFTHDLERLYQRMWTDYRAGTRQPIVSEAGDGGDSDSAEAHFNRANQLDDLKRHEEAVACYRKALAIDPGFAEALCNLAGTLNELRRHEEAVASCERAIALRPDIAEAHNNLGSALNALTRHAQALASCEKALALRPDFAEAHFNRGVALAGMQRHEEALASFRRAIALRPDFAEAHNSLGGALNDLGRHREAIESYQQAVTSYPPMPRHIPPWFTPASICARGPSLRRKSKRCASAWCKVSLAGFNHSAFWRCPPPNSGNSTSAHDSLPKRNIVPSWLARRCTALSCVPTRPGCASVICPVITTITRSCNCWRKSLRATIAASSRCSDIHAGRIIITQCVSACAQPSILFAMSPSCRTTMPRSRFSMTVLMFSWI